MYQLNKSKDAVIAHFSKEKKIETLFPENINSITPVAMNNQTENNSVHKIETLFQEEVKSILPVAIMNTQKNTPSIISAPPTDEYDFTIEFKHQPKFKFPSRELNTSPEIEAKIKASIERAILNSKKK
jgi:hypothetical protein